MVNNYNDMIYKTTKKTIADLGQDVGEGGEDTTSQTEVLFTDKAIVKYKKQVLQSGDNITELNDNIEFIMLRKIPVNSCIGFNNAWYKVVSVDDTIKGIYKMYTKFYTDCAIDKSTYDITIENRNPINIKVGEKEQLNCICTRNGVQESAPRCTYSVSDNSVCTIDENGLITGLQEGSTEINAIYNKKQASINIKVENVYTIDCADINKQYVQGDTVQLNPIYKVNNVATPSDFTYLVADNTICTVSTTGLVSILKDGATTITISNSKCTKIINVNIEKVDVYTIECADITLDMGAIAPLMYKLYKNGVEVTEDIPTFISSDNTICCGQAFL